MIAARPIAPSKGLYTPGGDAPVDGAPPWFRRRQGTRYWLFDLGPIEGEESLSCTVGGEPYDMARDSRCAMLHDEYRVAVAVLCQGMQATNLVPVHARKDGWPIH